LKFKRVFRKQYIAALWCVCASESVSITDGVIQPWSGERQQKGMEILSIGDNLLLTCTDRNIADPVLQVLCYTAKYMGNIPLAKSYAERLCFYIARNVQIKKSSAPEEQQKFEQLCIDLWESVLGDKDLIFYHCRVEDAYARLAAAIPYSQL